MRPVKAELVGRRIYVRTQYVDDVWERTEQLNLLKSVQGATFARGSRAWTYPLDLSVCRALRAKFGERLELGPQLTEWGHAEIQREQKLHGVLGLDLNDVPALTRLPAVAPGMWSAMQNRPYQPTAALFGATAGAHINGDEQGLGKCIEELGALIESGCEGKGLLIAPRTALNVTWTHEIERWMSDVDGDVLVQVATVRETSRGTVAAADAAERGRTIEEFLESAPNYRYAFLLINPQMLNTTRETICPLEGKKRQPCKGDDCHMKARHKTNPNHRFPLLHSTVWDFAMADETHLYLTHSTGKKPSQVGLGMSKLRVRPFRGEEEMRIAMTGTPAKGKPLNLFGTLNWVLPKTYTSKWSWGAHYCKTKPNAYTQSGLEILNELDPAHSKTLDKDLGRVMIRRTSGQLHANNPAWAPPPIQFLDKWVEMEPAQRKQMEQLLKDGAIEVGDSVLTADNHLSMMTRALQIATCPIGGIDRNGGIIPASPGPKFDWLVEEMLAGLAITGNKSTQDGDEKAIVISPFNTFLHCWRDTLEHIGIATFLLTGESNDAERAKMQRRFLKPGGPRVFLLNTTAGGVSLTLDSASYVAVMNQTWVPDDTEQAYKRAHRASRVDHSVRVYFPFVLDSIEADITGTNETKRLANWQLLDKRRGIEWAKRSWSK